VAQRPPRRRFAFTRPRCIATDGLISRQSAFLSISSPALSTGITIASSANPDIDEETSKSRRIEHSNPRERERTMQSSNCVTALCYVRLQYHPVSCSFPCTTRKPFSCSPIWSYTVNFSSPFVIIRRFTYLDFMWWNANLRVEGFHDAVSLLVTPELLTAPCTPSAPPPRSLILRQS